MSDDFPTFERPMKAYSGTLVFGHLRTSVLLTTKREDVIFIVVAVLFFARRQAIVTFSTSTPESECLSNVRAV